MAKKVVLGTVPVHPAGGGPINFDDSAYAIAGVTHSIAKEKS